MISHGGRELAGGERLKQMAEIEPNRRHPHPGPPPSRGREKDRAVM